MEINDYLYCAQFNFYIRIINVNSGTMLCDMYLPRNNVIDKNHYFPTDDKRLEKITDNAEIAQLILLGL